SISDLLPASGVLRWTPRVRVDDRTVRRALEGHHVTDAVGVMSTGRGRPLRVGPLGGRLLLLDGRRPHPLRDARLLDPSLRVVLRLPHVPLDGRPPHAAAPAHPVAYPVGVV